MLERQQPSLIQKPIPGMLNSMGMGRGSLEIDGITPSFAVNFTDKGAGEVNILSQAATGTFTRATTATTFSRDDPYLSLPGTSDNYASTPDSAAVSITGDIDIRVKVALDDWSPAGRIQRILSKWQVALGETRSWNVYVDANGRMNIQFSPDGTLASSITKTVVADLSALAADAIKYLRWVLDADNGAGGYDFKAYTSDDGDVWTQLGATVTTAGTAAIFVSPSRVMVGGINDGLVNDSMVGKVYYAEIRNGIDGPVVAKFDPSDATYSTNITSWTAKNTGEVWTVHGTAYILPGKIVSVASGVPRSYYDPTTGSYLGYLAEGARTNLALQSEDFSTTWGNTDVTVTANATTAPDGNTTADLLTQGTAGTAQTTQSVTATADATYTFTLFAKRGNAQWLRLTLSNAANFASAWFDLQNGVVGSNFAGGTGAFTAKSITAYPNGWYRLQLTGSVGNGVTAITMQAYIVSADSGNTRVNNSTFYAWGAQFENNASFASSYIPTAGATVTRNADVLTYPTTGWWSNVAGTVLGQLQRYTSDTASAGWFGIDNDVASTNRMELSWESSTFRFTYGDGSVLQNATVNSAPAANTTYKQAAAYSSVGASDVVAGGTVATNAIAPSIGASSKIYVGARFGGSAPFFGPISRVAYYPRRLPNTMLQSLTR